MGVTTHPHANCKVPDFLMQKHEQIGETLCKQKLITCSNR
jgi:hypothetical protein